MAVGKSGPAFLQDYKKGGVILDEKAVLPLSLAKELHAAGIPLPATTPNAYAAGEITLGPDNGNQRRSRFPKRLNDGVTFDAVRHLRKPLQGCTPVHVRRLRQLRPSEVSVREHIESCELFVILRVVA